MTKLTEQDIISWSSSEDEYMNEKHLEFYKELLIDLEKELIHNVQVTTNHLKEHVPAPDPADRATQEEEYALELRARDREHKLLLKLQASLRQIEDGSYGFCMDTGEPIGLRRLLARPTATLSLEAQERREKMKKQFAS